MKADPKTVRVEWDAHLTACKACRRYDPSRTATLAVVCLKGAPLIKGVLELDAAPGLKKRRRAQLEIYKRAMDITGTTGQTTKAKAKRAMRYVDL